MMGSNFAEGTCHNSLSNSWTRVFSPLTAETSKARSETPDILLTSDDSSSLVKIDDMEMDDEVIDQVDAVIAALQKYRDKEPEVSC